jgi:hypothetical protein
MAESRDYLEMAFHSIRCFTDDGKLDLGELDRIVAIAERDGVVDDNEKRILSGIVGRVREEEVNSTMAARLVELRGKLGLDLSLAKDP